MQLLRQEYKLLTELKTVFQSAAANQPAVAQFVCNVLVSGGKDSMALLHACARIARSKHFVTPVPVRFQVIHFDHKTRNGQSTLDAQFVTHQALAVGFPILHFTWPANPPTCGQTDFGDEQSHSSSFQSKSSQWRRSTCLALREKHGPAWIFLSAHHAGDHAETVLMNLIRGCGRNGLLGLQQRNTKTGIHRPLATWTSQSVIEYVAACSIPYREDASNALTCYTRNAIRHDVLPALRQLNPKIEETLMQMSENLRSFEGPVVSEPHLEPADKTLTPGKIYDIIKADYPEYNRLVTSQQVRNIARHSAETSRSRGRSTLEKGRRIPLSHGWNAAIEDSRLRLYPPNLAPSEE